MIIVTKTLSLPYYYDFSNIAPLKDIVFLDIETTGLSSNTSSLYMIGVVYHRQMEWHLRQWFADSFSSESEILSDFFQFLKDFTVIITYNGDSFDIPFLMKCISQYALPYSFESFQSFDIYKKIRVLSSILPIENLKLKTVEAFLGIEREDTYTGKELISVYHQFIQTKQESLYHILLQHNEDDLKHLPAILPMLGYLDIFSSEWKVAGYSLNTETSLFTAVLDCAVKVPVSISYQTDFYTLSIRGNQIIIELSVFIGELKYFFEPYSDYDYLPFEDRAIPKRLSQFVDSKYKQTATAATCYSKKHSVFLPVTKEDSMFEFFKADYRAKQLYIEYLDDPEFLLAYLRLLLS